MWVWKPPPAPSAGWTFVPVISLPLVGCRELGLGVLVPDHVSAAPTLFNMAFLFYIVSCEELFC